MPHFEKMLYDNALLLRVYTHLWRTTGDPLARRVAEETADFLLRDLRTDEGGFASALDADTVVDGHSHEGLTYAWTPGQLVEVLGPSDGARAAALLAVTADGHLRARVPRPCSCAPTPTTPRWWATTRARLLAARAPRPQPSRDDKVVTAWNGLAVAALAEAGVLLRACPTSSPPRRRRPTSCSTCTSSTGCCGAPRAAGSVGSAPRGARRPRRPRRGPARPAPGDGRAPVGGRGRSLLDVALERFVDEDGVLHDTANDAPPLFARPAGRTDNAEPCRCLGAGRRPC